LQRERRLRSFIERAVLFGSLFLLFASCSVGARYGYSDRIEASQPIPEFPWPPPQPSTSYTLPKDILKNYSTVGQLSDAILFALEQTGYVERSFFRTQTGGVALVTRLERISDDGSPAPETDRWPVGWQSTSLLTALHDLFYVSRGHYRVIVFIIQSASFSTSQDAVTGQEAKDWLRAGANILPPAIAARPFENGGCTVLIYEFTSDGTAARFVESRVPGKEQLARSGILDRLTR
jgi:hypothetical protein